MSLWLALALGALQGVSELFPVSSLAQTILLPALFGQPIDTHDFLAFVVALHVATAVALLIYFWKDWKVVFRAYLGSLKCGKLVYDQDSKFAWLLVAGTIVVGGIGFALKKKFDAFFFEDSSHYWIVGVILVINGGIMLLADFLKHQASRRQGADTTDPSAMADGQRKNAHDMTFVEGAAVGATQTLALFPGISRSGVAIVGGLLNGLSYEEASRFSFMLATYVIGLAGLVKMPALLKTENHHLLMMAIPSAVLAGITAYLSVKFLMKYFKHNRLSPFGYYCVVLGVIAIVRLRHG